jgi:ABC-2 type transport system permease protein
MLRLIAHKELREFVRDGRMVCAGGLMVVLLLTSLLLGWQQQQSAQAERITSQQLDYDAWLEQGPRHPHNAADQGMHVFKPQPPLSVIDPGIDPFVGSTIWLQAHRQSETKFRPAQDATGLKRFGSLSPAWILQVLAPLLIIILGFNAFAGEREQGTLRQLLSLGVSARRLLWGKALALGGAVAVLLSPGAVLVLAAVLGSVRPGGLPDTLARVALLGLGYGLYLGLTILAVLAVSALCKRSRTALFLLLSIWIGTVLIAPRTIADVATKSYPSPSRLGFDAALSDELDAASTSAWTSHFGVSTAWDPSLPLGKWGRALQVDDHSGYGVLDEHFGKLWDTFEKQQRIQEIGGILAPVVSLRAFSMAMAGTDFSHHRDFSNEAEKQRRLIQNVISDDLVRNADSLGDRHFSYKSGPELWEKIPRFDYRSPTVGFALQRHALSLAILAALFALSLLFARFAVSRRLVG